MRPADVSRAPPPRHRSARPSLVGRRAADHGVCATMTPDPRHGHRELRLGGPARTAVTSGRLVARGTPRSTARLDRARAAAAPPVAREIDRSSATADLDRAARNRLHASGAVAQEPRAAGVRPKRLARSPREVVPPLCDTAGRACPDRGRPPPRAGRHQRALEADGGFEIVGETQTGTQVLPLVGQTKPRPRAARPPHAAHGRARLPRRDPSAGTRR